MEVFYMSPNAYSCAFEALLDLHKCNLTSHWMGRLHFLTKNNCLILTTMDPGTPGARVNKWHTQLCSAWLIFINGTLVSSLYDIQHAFPQAYKTNAAHVHSSSHTQRSLRTSPIAVSPLCPKKTSPSSLMTNSTTALISSMMDPESCNPML
jgi:hypothetical protein